jgi:hypothetical protein
MQPFATIDPEGDLAAMIERVYETRLEVSGGWGYTPDSATRLHALPVSKMQVQFNLAYMRSYLEMNITRTPQERYGGIDLQETSRRREGTLEEVHYRVSGIPETLYNAFIDEYKAGYGRDDFDINDHFARRNDATLVRNVSYWFDLSDLA